MIQTLGSYSSGTSAPVADRVVFSVIDVIIGMKFCSTTYCGVFLFLITGGSEVDQR